MRSRALAQQAGLPSLLGRSGERPETLLLGRAFRDILSLIRLNSVVTRLRKRERTPLQPTGFRLFKLVGPSTGIRAVAPGSRRVVMGTGGRGHRDVPARPDRIRDVSMADRRSPITARAPEGRRIWGYGAYTSRWLGIAKEWIPDAPIGGLERRALGWRSAKSGRAADEAIKTNT